MGARLLFDPSESPEDAWKFSFIFHILLEVSSKSSLTVGDSQLEYIELDLNDIFYIALQNLRVELVSTAIKYETKHLEEIQGSQTSNSSENDLVMIIVRRQV